MLKDKGDNWAYMKWDDDEHVYWDTEGPREKLTAKHYELTFGKYKGMTLDEIDDAWYLQFLQKTADENEDWLLDKCLSLIEK